MPQRFSSLELAIPLFFETILLIGHYPRSQYSDIYQIFAPFNFHEIICVKSWSPIPDRF